MANNTTGWKLDFSSVEGLKPSAKLDPPGYDSALSRDWVGICLHSMYQAGQAAGTHADPSHVCTCCRLRAPAVTASGKTRS